MHAQGVPADGEIAAANDRHVMAACLPRRFATRDGVKKYEPPVPDARLTSAAGGSMPAIPGKGAQAQQSHYDCVTAVARKKHPLAPATPRPGLIGLLAREMCSAR